MLFWKLKVLRLYKNKTFFILFPSSSFVALCFLLFSLFLLFLFCSFLFTSPCFFFFNILLPATLSVSIKGTIPTRRSPLNRRVGTTRTQHSADRTYNDSNFPVELCHDPYRLRDDSSSYRVCAADMKNYSSLITRTNSTLPAKMWVKSTLWIQHGTQLPAAKGKKSWRSLLQRCRFIVAPRGGNRNCKLVT